MHSTSERDLRFVRKWVVSDRVKSEPEGDRAHEGARLALRFKARCTAQIER
jgi:hypothetical protein